MNDNGEAGGKTPKLQNVKRGLNDLGTINVEGAELLINPRGLSAETRAAILEAERQIEENTVADNGATSPRSISAALNPKSDTATPAASSRRPNLQFGREVLERMLKAQQSRAMRRTTNQALLADAHDSSPNVAGKAVPVPKSTANMDGLVNKGADSSGALSINFDGAEFIGNPRPLGLPDAERQIVEDNSDGDGVDDVSAAPVGKDRIE